MVLNVRFIISLPLPTIPISSPSTLPWKTKRPRVPYLLWWEIPNGKLLKRLGFVLKAICQMEFNLESVSTSERSDNRVTKFDAVVISWAAAYRVMRLLNLIHFKDRNIWKMIMKADLPETWREYSRSMTSWR